MSKHDNLKYLLKRKARKDYRCAQCDQEILPGQYYYSEQIDMVKPPSLVLYKFCEPCGLAKINA